MEDLHSWSSIIRSCVLTSKSPLTPFEINRDINTLEGRSIPYQQLNCRSLDELLRKIPGLKVSSVQGKTVIQAIPSVETAHISKMVKLQKSSKKVSRTLPPLLNKKSSCTFSNKGKNAAISNKYKSQNKYSMPNNSINSWDSQKKLHINSASHQGSFTEALNLPQNRDHKIDQVKKKASHSMSKKIHTHSNLTSQRLSPPLHRYSPSSHHYSSPPNRHSPPPNHHSPSSHRYSPLPHRHSPLSHLHSPPLNRHSPPPNRYSPLPHRHSPPPDHPPYRNLNSRQFNSSSQFPPQILMQKNVPLSMLPSLLGPGSGALGDLGSSSPITQRLNVVPKPSMHTSPSAVCDLTVIKNCNPITALDKKLGDPRLRLNSYTEARRLPLPIYKDLPIKNNFIYSSVNVNSKKYSSYPKEAKTKEEAEKLAAQAALDDLLSEDIKPPVTTVDRDLIRTRVLKIVNDYPNGLFESSVVECYIAKYNERLPENWIKLVEQLITLDIGANNLTILSPQNNLQICRPTKSFGSEPEILRLNNMEEFWLHIYVVYNITDIWGVIIDENHSDKIDELAKDMKTYYDADQSETPKVIPGKHYAVFDSEWHRVRCIKIDPINQTTTVFFIDRGDEDTFLVGRLRTLHPKFCQLPSQAVRLSMINLEIFRDCDEMQAMLEELLAEKDVYVRSMKYDQNYPNTISAQLYFERDDDEINVNELIKSEIIKKVLDPTIYMQSEKIAQDVYISYVSEKSIFIQLHSTGLTYLKMLINDLAKDYLNNSYFKPRPVLKFDTTKIYVAKNLDDNNWYRVKVTKHEDENQVEVYCIDEGNTLNIKKSNLILLEDLSELLVVYPVQAMQVQLHKISPIMFDKKMANHLRDLVPKTDVFYMKVVGKVEDFPIVEFYKRTEDNYLASLNDTLALEPEISSKDDNNNAKPRVRNDRSSIDACSEFPLKAPSIPSINSFFDVYIVMAAHPSNFTVQPLISSSSLETLMEKLLKVCESYTGPPLIPSSIKVGSMYAAKYDDDGRWYRGYVSKIINQNFCAIYFCDYGDYRALSLEQLLPLPNEFYDLPYQAIKARLYGVTPRLKGDWTVKDSMRFSDLVVAKTFVSIIKSCDMDNITSGETILGLELVDTSTKEDIYISNILVDEKRADKVKELEKAVK